VRIVLDTNVVLSALLWRGTPYHLFQTIRRQEHAQLFTSAALLEELGEVLIRPVPQKRLALLGSAAHEVLADYIDAVELARSAHRAGRLWLAVSLHSLAPQHSDTGSRTGRAPLDAAFSRSGRPRSVSSSRTKDPTHVSEITAASGAISCARFAIGEELRGERAFARSHSYLPTWYWFRAVGRIPCIFPC
jgi:putative PIN family toxin of toxin-antitoxin system